MARFRSGELNGIDLTRELSAMTDRHVAAIAGHYLAAYEKDVAVLMTGGNGRQTTCPQSDLDILVLVPEKMPGGLKEALSAMMLGLTDFGLPLNNGMPVRTIDECRERSKEDVTIWTSLLDRRAIWGRASLEALDAKMGALMESDRARFAVSRAKEQKTRQAAASHGREPDIKAGEGGFRALQTVQWLGKALHGTPEFGALAGHGLLTQGEAAQLRDAEKFLTAVRCHMHDIAGREEDHLIAPVQKEVAKRLGRGVEDFMQEYFRHSRAVEFISRMVSSLAIDRAEPLRGPKGGGFSWLRWIFEKEESGDAPVTACPPGFRETRAGFDFKDKDKLTARDLLWILEVTQERMAEVHPSALRRIREEALLTAPAGRPDPSCAALFLNILTSPNGSTETFRRMRDTGILAKIIPAFEGVAGLMPFDPFHAWPVDEHAFRCVEKLRVLEREGKETFCLTALERLRGEEGASNRRVLYMAALLHDLMKGQGEDHAAEGGLMAAEQCAALGMTAAEADKVSWLVRNHLLLSDTALRRDLEDEVTTGKFVSVVDASEKLDLLTLLTVADVQATGPDLWTAEKAARVGRLHDLARERLTRTGPGKEAGVRASALPADYRAGETRVTAADAPGRSATVFRVFTPDRSGLLQSLTAIFAMHSLNIVNIRAATRHNGVSTAEDEFIVQTSAGEACAADRLERLKAALAEACSSGFDDAAADEAINRMALTAGGRPSRLSSYPLQPRLRISNEDSAGRTMIEVEYRDRPGSLHMLMRLLHEKGYDVGTVVGTTYSPAEKKFKAVDVLYLSQKLTEDEIADLERSMKSLPFLRDDPSPALVV